MNWNDLDQGSRILLLVVPYGSLAVLFYFTRLEYIKSFTDHFMGKWGEDRVSDILQKALDDRYVYLRNLEIPYHGDIDGILIGPSEVVLMEIKTYSPFYEIRDGRFYISTGFGSFPIWWKSPIAQILDLKSIIDAHLKREGISIYVRPLVVFARCGYRTMGPTGVFVLTKENITDFILREELRSPSRMNISQEKLIETLECIANKN